MGSGGLRLEQRLVPANCKSDVHPLLSVCNTDNGMDNDGDSEGMTPYNFSRSSHPNFQLALNGLLIPQQTIDNAEAVHINRVKTKFDMHKRQPGSALLIHTPFSPLYFFFWFVFLVCLYYIRGVQSTYGVRLFINCCKLEFTIFLFVHYTVWYSSCTKSK